MQTNMNFLVTFFTTPWKKGQILKKHAKLQYQKDWMLIEIKGYVKPIEHQL